MNNNGQVVGTAQAADGSYHSYLWTKGTMVDLGNFGGSVSCVASINNRGQFVGTVANPPPNVPYKSCSGNVFLWADGETIDLRIVEYMKQQLPDDRLPPLVTVFVSGINDQGQIVGDVEFFTSGDALIVAGYLWDFGKVTLLDFVPIALSNDGTIIGYDYDWENWGGGVRSATALRDFSEIENRRLTNYGRISGARAINDFKQVVGVDNEQPAYPRAYIQDSNVRTFLGVLKHDQASAATSINNRGQVVGWSGLAGPEEPFDDDSGMSNQHFQWLHPFLWENERMVALDSLVEGDDTFARPLVCGGRWSALPTLTINDAGDIAGTLLTSTGEYHAFLLPHAD